MTPRLLRRMTMAGLGLVVGSTLASSSAHAVRNPIQGSSITVLAAGTVETLDPTQASTPAEKLIVANLFDRLVRRAADGRWQPTAAVSWQVTPDSLEWTFVLRPGMTFTDGRPVNAEAVVRSWERGDTTSAATRRLRGAMTADEKGAVFLRLKRRVTDPLAQFADPAYGIHAPIDGPNGGNLVGSGPFRLTRSADPGDFVLVPRMDHRLGRAIPAGVVVKSRPGQKKSFEGLSDVRGVISDPVSGTLDFSLAFSDGPPPAGPPRRTTRR